MVITILAGVFMLGVCIIIHELGHLLMGKAVGVKAEIFSVGYGRGIWKKKIGDTTWQVTAIPLGGYVKFYGDDYDEGRDVKGGFFSVSPLKRIIPVLGGPLFNLILGLIIFLGLGMFTAPPLTSTVAAGATTITANLDSRYSRCDDCDGHPDSH